MPLALLLVGLCTGACRAQVPAQTAASAAIDLSPIAAAGVLEITEAMQVLMQPLTAVSSPVQVLALPGWQQATPANRNGLWKHSAVWLTVRLDNRGTRALSTWIVIGSFRVAHVEMLLLDESGRQVIGRIDGGTRDPVQSDLSPAVNPTLPVSLAAGQSARLLILLKDHVVPVTRVHAWLPPQKARQVIDRLLVEAATLSLAVLLAMLLVFSPDRGLKLLGGWLLAVAVFDVSFRGHLLVWMLPGQRHLMVVVVALSGALLGLLFTLATRRLLHLDGRDAGLRLLLGIDMAATGCALAVPLLAEHSVALRCVNLLVGLHCLVWPVVVWRHRLPQGSALRMLRLTMSVGLAGMASYLLLIHAAPWMPASWRLPRLLQASAWIDYLAMGAVILIHLHITREARRQWRRQTEHLAYHDSLTGLPNRTSAGPRLQRTIDALAGRPPGATAAVLCLDIDRFKQINDTYGHAQGDRLLQSVARLLEGLIEGVDGMACRLSGDEFMLVLDDAGEHGCRALHLAAMACEAATRPLDLGGIQVHASLSMGIALAPVHGQDAETLMRHADAALYATKRAGDRRPRMFEPPMIARLTEHERIRTALHQSLRQGDFVLHFQPQQRLHDGHLAGVEALLRWQVPDGTVPATPDRFIPVAEESGLIAPLGEWVLREACRQAASWSQPVRVAVNVSAVQFRCGDFNDQVVRALRDSGLPPHRLELELTESVLIGHEDEAARWLAPLRDMGVQLAIDDFGTGYSSLSYLHRFPLDRLKIDRSFVQRMEQAGSTDAGLVATVVQIARRLGLETVAEGVESPATLARLSLLGCDVVQGYAIARPMPGEEMLRWLAARQQEVEGVPG